MESEKIPYNDEEDILDMLGAKLPQPQEKIEFGLKASSVRKEQQAPIKSEFANKLSTYTYNPKETRTAKVQVTQPQITNNQETSIIKEQDKSMNTSGLEMSKPSSSIGGNLISN